MNLGKVLRNVLGRGGLAQEGIVRVERLRIRVGNLVERGARDGGGREGRGGIDVLQERPTEIDNGLRGKDGYAGELGEVLAAVGVGGEMRYGGVGEENDGDGGNVSG